MKVAITGATGLIGTAVRQSLEGDGHEVLRLVRRPPVDAAEVEWDPQGGSVDADALAGVDAVVHLAGAGVGDHRWTASYKREIRDSRVLGTRTLARALAGLDPRPAVLRLRLGHRLLRRHRRRAGGRVVTGWRGLPRPGGCRVGGICGARRPRQASASCIHAAASWSPARAAPGVGCGRCSAWALAERSGAAASTGASSRFATRSGRSAA